MARDDGNLILSTEEKNMLLNQYPESKPLIRKLFGLNEFISSNERWCLWIEDEQLQIANAVPEIKRRIQKVFEFRTASKEKTTNGYAAIPHKLAQRCLKESIVPSTSSERRKYIPIGFLDKGTVITNYANAIYGADPIVFGIISSLLHNVWVRAVGGRLKTDFRYSKDVVYNTFPFPKISEEQKNELTKTTLRIIEEREKHPEKTNAELYDPDKMPDGLREAHHQNDLAVERCYRSKPFTSDEERLEHLFKLYEQMIEEEKNRGTLFEAEARPVKKGGKKKV